MAGPNFQMPAAISQMLDVQMTPDGKLLAINVRPDWAALFASLQATAYAGSRSGTTAQRPTDELKGRYPGMPYFDTTLGYTVFLKYASSNVWVDATGGVV